MIIQHNDAQLLASLGGITPRIMKLSITIKIVTLSITTICIKIQEQQAALHCYDDHY
jgi:hypothetical protein